MKRVGNLIEEIASLENLYLAFYKAKKTKWHKQNVLDYADNLDENLQSLNQQIITGNVNVGDYNFFKIYDPKERQICAASFAERVLHHAIINVCHQYIDNRLIYDTYATRIKKGTYKALDRAGIFSKKNNYFVKFDIRKYFDSIDHKIMKQILQKYFKDKKLLNIFDQIIDSYSVKKGKGLPIGNLTSQYFANMYLGELDNFIKHNLKIKYYIRYMDDFVFFVNSKSEIHFFSKQITDFIREKLKLTVKIFYSNKTSNGLSFLSYRVFPNKILLSKKAKKRFKVSIKKYAYLLKNNLISQEEYALHIRAYTAFEQKAYSKKYRNLVLKNIG